MLCELRGACHAARVGKSISDFMVVISCAETRRRRLLVLPITRMRDGEVRKEMFDGRQCSVTKCHASVPERQSVISG